MQKNGQRVEGHIGKAGFARNLHFPTPVVGKAQRFLARIAKAHEAIQNERLAIQGDRAAAVPDGLRQAALERRGRGGVQPHGDGKIADGQLFHDVHHEIGNGVGHFPPGFIQPAEDDVLVVLCVARAGGRFAFDPFAALDEERGQDFARLLPRERAACQIAPQEFAQHFIDAANARPIAAQPRESEQKPQRLHRLVEIFGRFEGHAQQELIQIGPRFARGGQIPPVPDAQGIDGVLQAGEEGALPRFERRVGRPLADFPLHGVHAQLQRPVETQRQMADAGERQFPSARGGHVVRDGRAQRGRAAHALLGRNAQGRAPRDFADGRVVLSHRRKRVKPFHAVQRYRPVAHGLVAIFSVQGFQRELPRGLAQAHGPSLRANAVKHAAILLCRRMPPAIVSQ